ncbi:MAG: alpha/beta hydrolase [Acidobacteriota bacterium]
MKKRTFLVSSTLLLALLLSAPLTAQATAANDNADAWSIAARALPAPAAASDAVRKAIAATPAPNPDQRRGLKMTDDQWRAMQSAGAPNLDELAKLAGVGIEKKEIAGVPVYVVTPNEVSPKHENHLFFHVHGGGYVLGGGDSAVTEAVSFASLMGIRAVSVDYRMPPDHPFPAAVDDAVAVFKAVTQDRPANALFIGGTSAGGGLTLATTLKLKEIGHDLPGALWLGTPWADLTKTSDSLYTNEGIDRVLVTYDGMLGAMAKLYAGDKDLKHPLISPLYGDFNGLPPTQLVTGTRDMFLSDTARTHRKLRGAGVEADLNVYEALSHAEYLMVQGSPESKEVADDLSAFLVEHLP